MQAAVLEQHGADFRLAPVSRPAAGFGEVLVRIMASGINPLDVEIHAGAADHARHPLPSILGIYLAGVVEAVGPGVSGFRPGDEVYGMTGGVGGVQGSLAQFAAVDADLLALKPANLTMREAAAMPLTFTTAWEGLVDRVRVQAGCKLLVHGGAGGVGSMAVQIGRASGAEVSATGSVDQAQTIEPLGAAASNYQTESLDAYLARRTNSKGFDLVFDTLGGPVLDASFLAVRRFGHVVSSLGWGTHALAPLSFRAATYSGVFTLLPLLTGEGRAHHGDILRDGAKFVETGQVTAILDPRRFTLQTVREAYTAITNRSTRGKLVVDITH